MGNKGKKGKNDKSIRKYKKTKKTDAKSILRKLDRVIDYVDDHMYNGKCEVACEERYTYKYDDKIEEEIMNYLDLSLEYNDKVSNIKIEHNENYLHINGNKCTLSTSGHVIGEEYFNITFDIKMKMIEINGNIFGDNRMCMKYKKLDSYIDKIILLKSKLDRNNFMNNFMKLYDVSELSREKSLKELDLD